MFVPRQDYILIKPLDREHSKILEVVSHEKHCRGEVVSVGPGKRDKKGNLKPLDAKPGDIVHFGDGSFDFYPQYQDTPEGPVFRLIQEADVAFIEDKRNQELAA